MIDHDAIGQAVALEVNRAVAAELLAWAERLEVLPDPRTLMFAERMRERAGDVDGHGRARPPSLRCSEPAARWAAATWSVCCWLAPDTHDRAIDRVLERLAALVDLADLTASAIGAADSCQEHGDHMAASRVYRVLRRLGA